MMKKWAGASEEKTGQEQELEMQHHRLTIRHRGKEKLISPPITLHPSTKLILQPRGALVELQRCCTHYSSFVMLGTKGSILSHPMAIQSRGILRGKYAKPACMSW